MTQPDAGLDVIALLVRPTVQQRASHAPQGLLVDRALVLMPDSCYAAHWISRSEVTARVEQLSIKYRPTPRNLL